MVLAVKSTLDPAYCPLRGRKQSDLRILSSIPSSESASEPPEDSSENSSESIDSLIQGLAVEPDFAIDIDELDIPLTMADAARRLGLSGTQSANYRLNSLYKHFDVSLLKEGKRLTPLAWKLMQGLSTKSVDELWAEYQETIAVESHPEPEILEAEVIDAAEVGGTLALRAKSILNTIGDAEIPIIDFRQNYDGMMAVAAAIGEKTGQQMAMVQLNSMVAAYQATLTQAQLAGVK